MVDSDIFRVKIELGNFFSDHKSKAYVSVNRQWKNVRQFHRHIGEIFDVKKFVLLTSDGVYLPAKEHIGIIESGDIIHVIPKQDDTESVVSAVSDEMVTLTEQNINKHLHTNDGATFKAPNSVSPSIEIISSRKSNTLTAGDDDIESVATTDTNGTTGSKRKRVRHRKKKNNAAANDENQMNLPNIEAQSGDIPKSNPFAHSKPKHDKSTPKSNTHVRFEEDDESLSELDEEVILPKIARVIHANITDVTPIVNTAVETPVTNGVEAEAEPEAQIQASNVTLEPPEVQPINGNNADNGNLPLEKAEPALEQLAKNLETIGKYKDMHNDVKEMDMIAFKVFTLNFEKSDYVIGLVESIIGRTTPEQQDYDLMLQIMAGGKHIEHLSDPTSDENDTIRIQINRMDIFDAKILTL
ncbi:uncharacterized protein LOC129567971 isoform X3 [Sitodiplosis mosellana]|uniref:uncharacterized protein LOC129567971 isoform X3 n=1 Tax=Sitodiplosis mosellana TaxID=263140 RepID=UPI002443AAE1|nr:uncharacterized protein LOC129567971 isoform X3 [Sitodiplosis mosellana]